MKIRKYAFYRSLDIIPSITIDWRLFGPIKKLTSVWITLSFLFWTIEIYLWEINDEDHINMIHELDKKISNVRDK